MLAYTDIDHWRSQIFSRLLTIVAVLGTVLAIPSIALSFKEGLYSLILADVAGLGWILALWRLRRIPYKTRVLNFLAVLNLIGISLMLSVGPVSMIFLLAPPVMAAVLLGTIPALLALALGALSIFVLGLTGHAKLYVTGMPDYALVPTLMITFNFICVGFLITIPGAVLLRRLSKSVDSLQVFAESLERGQDDLRKLNAELSLHAAAVARLNDMVLIAQVAGSSAEGDQPIIFVNEAFEQRTGYRREDVIGRSLRVLQGPATDQAEVARIMQAMARVEPVTSEILSYTKSGEQFWAEMELVPFADEGGVHTHLVVVARDITERKKSARAIHRLAFYDVLTGLPNRRMLMDRLEQLLKLAQAGAGFGAVMFVDLDHFKFINDARGHATGDAVLRAAAERLEQLVRKEDTIARLGGDEFVVLLANLGNDTDSAMRASLRVAEKVRNVLAEGFEFEGQVYTSSASIGVSLLPKPGQTAQDLLREADTAMYRAKAAGRNSVMFYEAKMQADMEHRLTLERDLGAALANGELAMHMQIQVDSAGKPTGAELLMRWQRAHGAMVPPDVFIPVAEASGLIVPIGHWALRQACLAWLELDRAGRAVPLSVNVSPSQFRQPDFVAKVRAVLEETGAPAGQLIFEVTEGLLIDDLDKTISRMHELAAMGIRFSIDDFGTGYSNLGYLKRMPLYELKIDKSFIRDTPGDANSAALVQSILAMAGHLGLRVVAEGVETVEQAQFLASNGSPQMQGYLFGRPAPLASLIATLQAA
ncbi:putative bifunctional diguanylate cyclase/phosphodiesterase [Pseudoduganella sp. GCM10020061]|uniref:putative bifunctional diguanylate cyclase/phosphodiesterase n=1 Tax=Pseudoduganella sp. GCM10020061 TaxID=3317345 RepID=UPI003638282C